MASAMGKKILFTINHRCFGFGVAGRKWTRHIHHSLQQGGANGRNVRSLNWHSNCRRFSFRSFFLRNGRGHIRVRNRNNCHHHKNYDSYFPSFVFHVGILVLNFIIIAVVRLCNVFCVRDENGKQKKSEKTHTKKLWFFAFPFFGSNLSRRMKPL